MSADRSPAQFATLSDVGTDATWTPVDSSGAALAFTGAEGSWERIGRRTVIVRGSLTFPVTADGTTATIGGLPFPIPNTPGACQGFISMCDETTAARLHPQAGTSTFRIVTTAGALLTNATMSGNLIRFTLIYPLD